VSTSISTNDAAIHGLMAEFDSAQELLDAAHKAHEAGYRKSRLTVRSRSRGLPKRLAFTRTACRWLY